MSETLRARVVAVAGPKGSPGCTLVAVALAGCLGARGLDTLLVDADAEDRCVRCYVKAPPLVGPAWQPFPAQTEVPASAIRAHAQALAERLWLLELALSGHERPGEGRELVSSARLLYPAVVIDLGHLLGPQQRELAAAADWLLWVTVPDLLGLPRGDRMLAAHRGLGASPGLVLNRVGAASVTGAGPALSERHRMPVLAQLPDSPGAAREALRGRPLHMSRHFRSRLLELAKCVHPDVQGSTRSWP